MEVSSTGTLGCMGTQIEMEILFGGETADPIARPNRGSVQTMGPVLKSRGKRGSLVFMEGYLEK